MGFWPRIRKECLKEASWHFMPFRCQLVLRELAVSHNMCIALAYPLLSLFAIASK